VPIKMTSGNEKHTTSSLSDAKFKLIDERRRIHEAKNSKFGQICSFRHADVI